MGEKTVSKLTEKEYVEKRGLQCIKCGAYSSLEGGFIDVDEGGAYQHVKCLECGDGWTDVYALVGVLDE